MHFGNSISKQYRCRNSIYGSFPSSRVINIPSTYRTVLPNAFLAKHNFFRGAIS